MPLSSCKGERAAYRLYRDPSFKLSYCSPPDISFTMEAGYRLRADSLERSTQVTAPSLNSPVIYGATFPVFATAAKARHRSVDRGHGPLRLIPCASASEKRLRFQTIVDRRMLALHVSTLVEAFGPSLLVKEIWK